MNICEGYINKIQYMFMEFLSGQNRENGRQVIK